MTTRSKAHLSRLAMLPIMLAMVAVPAAVHAAGLANLGFLRNTPLAYFRQQDFDMMMATVREVLDSSDPAAERSWANAKTGASGSVRNVGQFTATDGALCKRLRVRDQVKNLEGEMRYTVCKYPDRGWILNADARPAP